MRPTFDRRLWILLYILSIQCISYTNQQNIKIQNTNHQHRQPPADLPADGSWTQRRSSRLHSESIAESDFLQSADDNKLPLYDYQKQQQYNDEPIVYNKHTEKCANNCLVQNQRESAQSQAKAQAQSFTSIQTKTLSLSSSRFSSDANTASSSLSNAKSSARKNFAAKPTAPSQSPLLTEYKSSPQIVQSTKKSSPAKKVKSNNNKATLQHHRPTYQRVHVAHRIQHKEVKTHHGIHESRKRKDFDVLRTLIHAEAGNLSSRSRRETDLESSLLSSGEVPLNENQSGEQDATFSGKHLRTTATTKFESPSNGDQFSATALQQPTTGLKSFSTSYSNGSASSDANYVQLPLKSKRARSTVTLPVEAKTSVHKIKKEPVIIIDDVEEFDSGTDRDLTIMTGDDKSEDYSHDEPPEPRVLPLRPLPPNPYDDEEMSVVYAEQHSEIRLMCEVDLDIATSTWYKNGQVVHAMDRTSRATDYRFIKEANGALTITNVMLEDDGKWQCEAENTRRYTENARPVKLVVLDRPKPPYLLIDSRRLDAGNIFVPVKENSELNLACISEGGNPKPTLTWEVLLSPGVDRHAQKVSAEVLELEEVKNDKDKNAYKINSGAKSEARLPAVYRAHHNARILCVMEHPTLKIRQNASLLLDVQYTPSFAISRTPGFGYPLREGIEVSLKCDVDSNPPSTPRWQKDDGETPVPQTGDGFLNFTSIRREHSGWYKCTSRHLNFQYSSIGYYLSVRYDSVDVTSEPDDQDISVAAASHNLNKGQLEVQLGGAVTLQCPQGSLGCWSHLDPVTARLRGLGHGLSTPTGQFSLKDVVYQDAGTYKCIGQSPTNKKKLEVLQTVGVSVKGAPTVTARNATPVAYPGSPLHLEVEFCANPPAHAARWLHGDRVFTPGNQYGTSVLAYGVKDLPTPYCKEARLTYVSMHERVPRTFYFIVSTPGGVAEAVFKVNFTMRYRTISNAIDDEEEELSEPEEIHFPVFGASSAPTTSHWLLLTSILWMLCNYRSSTLKK